MNAASSRVNTGMVSEARQSERTVAALVLTYYRPLVTFSDGDLNKSVDDMNLCFDVFVVRIKITLINPEEKFRIFRTKLEWTSCVKHRLYITLTCFLC